MPNSNDDDISTVAVAFTLLAIAAGVWKGAEIAGNAVKGFIDSRSKTEAERLYSEAIAYLNQGNLQEATRLCYQVISKNPANSAPYNCIAWEWAIRSHIIVNDHTRQSTLNESERLVKEALRLSNNLRDKANYLDTLAEVYLRKGQMDDAIRVFHECMNWRQFPDLYYRLAGCYSAKGDLSSSYNCLKEGIGRDPKNVDILIRLGAICLELSKYKEAIRYFKEAIRLIEEYNLHIKIKARTEDYPKFMTDWGEYYLPDQETISIKKSLCLNDIGVAYAELEKHEESKKAYQNSCEVFPQNPFAIYNLTCLASRNQDKEEVCSLLEELMPLLGTNLYWKFVRKDSYDQDTLNGGIPHCIIYLDGLRLRQNLLCDRDLEKYRDTILDLLKQSGYLTEREYRRYMKDWMEGRYDQPAKNHRATVINIAHSTLGVLATGDDGNISEAKVSKTEISSRQNIDSHEKKTEVSPTSLLHEQSLVLPQQEADIFETKPEINSLKQSEKTGAMHEKDSSLLNQLPETVTVEVEIQQRKVFSRKFPSDHSKSDGDDQSKTSKFQRRF